MTYLVLYLVFGFLLGGYAAFTAPHVETARKFGLACLFLWPRVLLGEIFILIYQVSDKWYWRSK